MLYKNVRDVRFLLFTKISNIQQIEHTPEKLNREDMIGLFYQANLIWQFSLNWIKKKHNNWPFRVIQ